MNTKPKRAVSLLVFKRQQAEVKLLRRIVSSYYIQCKAAMRATSLGLCKKVVKHAIEDEQVLRRGKK